MQTRRKWKVIKFGKSESTNELGRTSADFFLKKEDKLDKNLFLNKLNKFH